MKSKGTHRYAWWPFIAGLAAGLVFVTIPITRWSFEFFPGDLADGRFNLYIIEHAWKWMTFQVDDFWNAPFMWPEPDVITYSDNLLGTAPFFGLFRIFGATRETAFQWWFITLSILNYACAYLFIHRVFKKPLCGCPWSDGLCLLYGFAIPVGPRSNLSAVCHSLAFYFGMGFLDNLDPKYFFGALLLMVYEIYCGIYNGFLLVVPLGFSWSLSCGSNGNCCSGN